MLPCKHSSTSMKFHVRPANLNYVSLLLINILIVFLWYMSEDSPLFQVGVVMNLNQKYYFVVYIYIFILAVVFNPRFKLYGTDLYGVNSKKNFNLH